MRLSDVGRFIGPSFQRGGRFDRVRTSGDFARVARRRVPRPVFDYVEGGAERETSVRRATAAFDQVTFHPHVLRDVGSVDTSPTTTGCRVVKTRPTRPEDDGSVKSFALSG